MGPRRRGPVRGEGRAPLPRSLCPRRLGRVELGGGGLLHPCRSAAGPPSRLPHRACTRAASLRAAARPCGSAPGRWDRPPRRFGAWGRAGTGPWATAPDGELSVRVCGRDGDRRGRANVGGPSHVPPPRHAGNRGKPRIPGSGRGRGSGFSRHAFWDDAPRGNAEPAGGCRAPLRVPSVARLPTRPPAGRPEAAAGDAPRGIGTVSLTQEPGT